MASSSVFSDCKSTQRPNPEESIKSDQMAAKEFDEKVSSSEGRRDDGCLI